MSPASESHQLPRIVSVRVRDGYVVELRFTDGAERVVDLEPYLSGSAFQPLRDDPHLFNQVRVDARAGTIAWPNGADLDPDVLYWGGAPPWARDLATGAG